MYLYIWIYRQDRNCSNSKGRGVSASKRFLPILIWIPNPFTPESVAVVGHQS